MLFNNFKMSSVTKHIVTAAVCLFSFLSTLSLQCSVLKKRKKDRKVIFSCKLHLPFRKSFTTAIELLGYSSQKLLWNSLCSMPVKVITTLCSSIPSTKINGGIHGHLSCLRKYYFWCISKYISDTQWIN